MDKKNYKFFGTAQIISVCMRMIEGRTQEEWAYSPQYKKEVRKKNYIKNNSTNIKRTKKWEKLMGFLYVGLMTKNNPYLID